MYANFMSSIIICILIALIIIWYLIDKSIVSINWISFVVGCVTALINYIVSTVANWEEDKKRMLSLLENYIEEIEITNKKIVRLMCENTEENNRSI